MAGTIFVRCFIPHHRTVLRDLGILQKSGQEMLETQPEYPHRDYISDVVDDVHERSSVLNLSIWNLRSSLL
jgi:Co/Zn/Cd efflux system component